MTHKEHPELVTRGPYRPVRHPIYTRFLLAPVGTCRHCGSTRLDLVDRDRTRRDLLRLCRDHRSGSWPSSSLIRIGPAGSPKMLLPFIY
jgi:hypothetical protein